MNRFFQIDNKTWYCISIFYSKDEWRALLDDIFTFRDENKSISDCITFFSEEKGEHISVAYSSQTKNPAKLQTNIDKHFTKFLQKIPTSYSKPFEYGKLFWSHYPVNTTVWNNFGLKRHILGIGNNINIYNHTTWLVSDIIENDFTELNLWSTALFLYVSLCKLIAPKNLIPTIDKIINSISARNEISWPDNHDHIHQSIEENNDTISAYWHYSDDDDVYQQWLVEINNRIHDNDHQSCYLLFRIINLQLGILDFDFLLLLDLLKRWLKANEYLLTHSDK